MIGLGGRGSGVDSMTFLQDLLTVVTDPKKVEEHLKQIREERDQTKAVLADLDKARADHDLREQDLRDREANVAHRAAALERMRADLDARQIAMNDADERHKAAASTAKLALDSRATEIAAAQAELDDRKKLVVSSEKAIEEERCRLADKEVELATREKEISARETRLAEDRKALADRWGTMQQLMRNVL
jgi:uncharacterized protein (DUF3084 family)